MKRLITSVLVAALLASGAVAPVLASGGYRHYGVGHGHSYYAGRHFKHRRHHGYSNRHGYGGRYYFHGDGAVVLGVLAGAVVLGALLSRPTLTRPSVLRSPTGAPLGSCLATTGTGIRYGRPAQFSGTMCYDSTGRAYVLPRSVRFEGYLR